MSGPQRARGPGFLVRVGGRVRGPLPADELVSLPDFSLHTLVCPEDRNVSERRNWVFARSFPAIVLALERKPAVAGMSAKAALLGEIEAVSKPVETPASDPAAAGRGGPGPALGWVLLAAAGAALAVVLSLNGPSPDDGAPRPALERPTELRRAATLALPSCLGEEGQGLVSKAQWRFDRGGVRFVLPLTPSHGGGEALFAFEDSGRSVKPLNEDAVRIMDFRRSCAETGGRARGRAP